MIAVSSLGFDPPRWQMSTSGGVTEELGPAEWWCASSASAVWFTIATIAIDMLTRSENDTKKPRQPSTASECRAPQPDDGAG